MDDICIDELFDDLFPICRSITGPGIRDSFALIQKYIPLKINSVPTGERVFDWTVPQEWRLARATLKDPDGKIILDTNISNLHVINFSTPFRGTINLNELQGHLYSIPELPHAIPYVTSYYSRRWGFCMTDTQRQSLKDGMYQVHIDTEICDGELNYATFDLPGKSSDIILISSYLCHPSLANNELSGPLALVLLHQKLARLKDRQYTYKFLLIPETIGSLTFLAKEGSALSSRIRGGIVLTCLGGPKKTVSFKLSRSDWLGASSSIDVCARQLAQYDQNSYEVRAFDPTEGSDERQFCSPGINWPVIQAAKTVYGQYQGYHNSLDTKEFMSIEAVTDSAEKLFVFLRVFDFGDKKLMPNVLGGEPCLGKRGLYPTINSPLNNNFSSDSLKDHRYLLNLMLNVLSLTDGTMTLFDIARKLQTPLADLLTVAELLIENDLVSLGE